VVWIKLEKIAKTIMVMLFGLLRFEFMLVICCSYHDVLSEEMLSEVCDRML